MAGRIFINYRREDARDPAARLRDRLAAVFGEANVFMDVTDLKAGQRFDVELDKALADTDAFISVIGPRWMELFDARKASGERDFVREEIAQALRRSRGASASADGAPGRATLVIPVVIERTPLPRADDLTPDIRDLVMHHKLELTHERFNRDVEDLVAVLKPVLGEPPSGTATAQPAAPVQPAPASRMLLILGAVLVAAMAAAGLFFGGYIGRPETAAPAPTPVAVKSAAASPSASPSEVVVRRKTPAGCPECPEMVMIPDGTFTMGSTAADTEQPVHHVTIRRPFEVSRYAVTFEEWDACVAAGGCTSNPRPSDEGWGRGTRPVVNVSWNDAKQYAEWLSGRTGQRYRLLTEAEWEYVARAGSAARFSWGDAAGIGNTNCSGCGSRWDGKGTAPVGSFKPNAWGLHDVHGNVWQWVEDSWHPGYRDAPDDGSARRDGEAAFRVARGGSWRLAPDVLRASIRLRVNATARGSDIGFRLARTL